MLLLLLTHDLVVYALGCIGGMVVMLVACVVVARQMAKREIARVTVEAEEIRKRLTPAQMAELERIRTNLALLKFEILEHDTVIQELPELPPQPLQS